MIKVTRLGGKPFYLNSDLIEALEALPDTTLLLTTGKRVLVLESVDEVVRRIVEFRRQIHAAVAADDPSGAARPVAPAASSRGGATAATGAGGAA